MAMKNVANDPKQSYNLFGGLYSQALPMFIVINKMRSTVQWLTERCFKHAQVPGFNLVGVVSIKKKVVRHCT